MPYTRKEFKFASRGVVVSRPSDLLGDDEHPFMLNVRALQQGALTNRPGTTAINATPIPDLRVHSIVRLNNYLPSASQSFARFIGGGTSLYSDNAAHTTFTSRATGFSGRPLQFVVMRPEESPEPWLYIGDGTKSGKARVNGTFYNHGIAPPTVPPYAQPGATSYKIIDNFEAVGAWTNGGTAGAITAPTRVATTIAKIVFDTGTTGWATVNPTALDESFQPGMLIIVNSGGGTQETVLVESVSEAVTNTTISSISYDTGTTGAATIQLSAPTAGLARDSMLRIDSGGGTDEVVRVLSVTDGPGGLPSFKAVTVNTQTAGKTITGLRSFRSLFISTHAVAETLGSKNLESTITLGIGYITLVAALDLSSVNSRPVTDDDIIHISIKVDDLTLVTEGRIAFDVDSTTNDFTQNYYYWAFRANDLTPATVSTITTLAAQQRIIQRGQIERNPRTGSILLSHIERAQGNEGPIMDSPPDEGVVPSDPAFPDDNPTQTTLGASQWTELRIRVGDLLKFRVGSDTSRSLHDVAAIRVQLQTTGTVVLDADAWWIGGTFGANSLPDVGVGAPYNYRYIYRSSATGAISNPSPSMREGINVRRQQINGTVTASADAQVDYIDIYRTGGALITSDNSPPWFFVMSVSNVSTTFIDQFPDDIVIRKRQLSFDNFQPFLDLDIPRSGIVNVSGTEITRVSGDNFNAAWPAGTIMVINNVPYTLYTQPSSTTRLSLNENAGTQTGVNWFITSPRLLAQPLPSLWGPFGGGLFEPVMFACGSLNQPGKVFWTSPGAPDSNSVFGSLELTSPSEPLMNGCVFRSQAYVFSSEGLFVLQPTEVSGLLQFSGARVAGSRGLYSRYAFCIGDEGIFYLSRDGIYLTTGAESISITDELLYPLFPHEGTNPVAINGINPPDFTLTDNLRLSYGESMLYFDFIDSANALSTLVFDIKVKGWFYYRYPTGANIHYTEEGASLNSILIGGDTGKLYLSGGSTDAGTPIPCIVHTNWFDSGDPRSNKQWANGMLDVKGTVNVAVYVDNATTLLNTLNVVKTSRGQQVLDFKQEIHRNLQLQISGDAPLTLYGYSMDFTKVSVSELTEQRNAYATEFLFPEYGIVHYLYLGHISTANITLTITVDSLPPDTYTILSGAGVLVKPLVMLKARKGKLWTFNFTSSAEFQIIPSQTVMKAKAWNSTGPFEDRQFLGDMT